MLYVDVIVKQRSKVEELTYAVPASMVPYIRSGSLVTAPLRRRIVEGTVVALRRTISRELKDKIKPLTTIERGAVLREQQITVVRKLADYYGASLGEVGFHALDQPYTLPTQTTSTAAVRPVFLQLPARQRFETYLRLITKHRNASFLCIFAQRTFLEDFCRIAKEQRVGVLIADETVRFRKIIVAHIEAKKRFVVAATSSGAFLPLSAGDGLIIDQPSHIGLKQQQRPYMRVKTIARVRAECEHLRLFYGDDLPETVDILRFQRNEWLLRTAAGTTALLSVASRLRSSEVLLPSVLEQLRLVAAQGGRCLVIALARGWASAFVCRECGHVFACPHCQRTMAVEQGHLVCRYDQTVMVLPANCPICRSNSLHQVGEGVERITSEIKSRVPGVSIHQLSSDQPELSRQGVVVATEKILSFPREHFDLIVLASVDRLLSGVNINDRWELVRLLRICATTADRCLAQTFFPDDPIWAAGTNQLRSFFARELGSRRTWKLPPYGQLFQLIAHGSDKRALMNAAADLRSIISNTVPSAVIGAIEVVPLGPKRFRAQLTVTSKFLSVSQKRELGAALPFAWHLDLEP